MRTLIAVLALALLASLSSTALAKGNKAGKGNKPAKPVIGTVSSVDTTSNTIVVTTKHKKNPQVTVAVDTNATITVNGVPGKLSDVKADMKIKISGSGAAQKIDASSMANGKNNGKKKGKGK